MPATLPVLLPTLLLLAWTHPFNLAFMSQFEADFNYTCPDNTALRAIESVHQPRHLDRLWHFDCCTSEEVPLGQCDWTDWVNDFDKEMNYICGYDKVVAGVATNFSIPMRDRKWQFRCCSLGANWIVHSCYYTDYLNNYTDAVSYKAPQGWFISGLQSVDDWHTNDRIFKVHVCKLDQLISNNVVG